MDQSSANNSVVSFRQLLPYPMEEIRKHITGPLNEIVQQVRDNWDRILMIEVAIGTMCFALMLILIIVAKQDLGKPRRQVEPSLREDETELA